MLAKEGEHLAPAIHCLLGSIEWPVPIEDAVAGTVVAIELKSIFRHAHGKKGTLLAQVLRKGRVQHEDTSPLAKVRPHVNAESVRDPERTT